MCVWGWICEVGFIEVGFHELRSGFIDFLIFNLESEFAVKEKFVKVTFFGFIYKNHLGLINVSSLHFKFKRIRT